MVCVHRLCMHGVYAFYVCACLKCFPFYIDTHISHNSITLFHGCWLSQIFLDISVFFSWHNFWFTGFWMSPRTDFHLMTVWQLCIVFIEILSFAWFFKFTKSILAILANLILNFSRFISGIQMARLGFDSKGVELTLPFGVSRLTLPNSQSHCHCSICWTSSCSLL